MKTSEHRREIVRRSREKNKHKYVEKKKQADNEYYQKNKNLLQPKRAKYREENRAKINKQSQKINKERLKTDDAYRIACLCRTRVKNFLRSKNVLQTGKTFDLIGCTNEFLRAELQSQVEHGKTVRDYDIDHIFALALYDMEREQPKAMHWTNLQLLEKRKNRSKAASLPTKDMALKVDRDKWPTTVRALSMLPDNH